MLEILLSGYVGVPIFVFLAAPSLRPRQWNLKWKRPRADCIADLAPSSCLGGFNARWQSARWSRHSHGAYDDGALGIPKKPTVPSPAGALDPMAGCSSGKLPASGPAHEAMYCRF